MSIDMAVFEHSDYNTLINNVSGSPISLLFKKINPYQKGILEPVEIMDSNYSNPSYIRSRYEGSKTTSAVFTFYTSQSIIKQYDELIKWEGDRSYGQTAAADYNSEKFAFANSINDKNLNFYDKTTVNIKYLISETGSITELSRRNYNVFEVQNIFKKGDYLNVSLLDKLNPTNQSSLDGSKLIWEGGFSYSPIIYREINEDLRFTYIKPNISTENRLGVKSINTGSYVFRTIGDTNGDLNTTPNGTSNIFTINGISTTILTFSLSKTDSRYWPYTKIPLSDFNKVRYKDYTGAQTFVSSTDFLEDGASFYTLDWFIPLLNSAGYITNDFSGKLNVVSAGSQYYTYVQAPRDSTYSINVDLAIKAKATNREALLERDSERGPSIIKIVGVVEVQKAGSSTWEYLDSSGNPYGYTKFTATNIPIGTFLGGVGTGGLGDNRALVNEDLSFIHFPEETSGNSGGALGNRTITPFFEGICNISNLKIPLKQDDKIRIVFYFAEATTFFRRSENVYFEMQAGDSSKSYFEVYDANTANVTQVTTATIGVDPVIFEPISDNQTIVFSEEASLLYGEAYFDPEYDSDPTSITNNYSPVEHPFTFKVGDVIRFSQFFSIEPDYYTVIEVVEPVIVEEGLQRSVLIPASVKLDRQYNPNDIKSSSFAILRKVDDETVIILDFKKREGKPSNAYIIPNNILPEIKKNLGNIVAPLKDTLLTKVLST